MHQPIDRRAVRLIKTSLILLAIALVISLLVVACTFLQPRATPVDPRPAPLPPASASPSSHSPSIDPPGPSSAAPTSAPAAQLRVIHTPAIVIDDMALKPGQCAVRYLDKKNGLVLPDPMCTPGAIDPAVTQENIASTICVAGYTKTVRPSSSATNKLKAVSYDAYGLAYDKNIEFDHHVPLTLGGASSMSNLWVQPNYEGAESFHNKKDAVEVRVNKAVCRGDVALAEAQLAIATDWTTAEKKLGLKP